MSKIAEIIKYEGDNSTFIWKHPSEDFNSLTQLIVHESQEAVFFMNGQALDLFGPGRYTLETQNIPATKLQLGIVCANGFNLKKLLYMPFVQTGESFTMIFKTLGALFTDKSVGVDDLSGPVGIFTLLKNATKEGVLTILSWTAILSVNIGFMNLLPLPALDGGRIAFMAYEAITRRKPNAKVENTIHAIGFILLMGLMLFVSFNDVLRCIGCR